MTEVQRSDIEVLIDVPRSTLGMRQSVEVWCGTLWVGCL